MRICTCRQCGARARHICRQCRRAACEACARTDNEGWWICNPCASRNQRQRSRRGDFRGYQDKSPAEIARPEPLQSGFPNEKAQDAQK